MLYTASYYNFSHQHGRLIAISNTIPKRFKVSERLDFLAPNYNLLAVWKRREINEVEYLALYRRQLKDIWDSKVNPWLNSLNPQDDQTLLSWELKGDFSHRNLVYKLVASHRPDCIGGQDTVKKIIRIPVLGKL